MAASIEHIRIQANGITFHVAVAGASDAPPVFCLHGFPEGWMSWRPVMEALGEARLYAPDLRGYGETARPSDGYDVFTLTDDIRALIEALGIHRPVLVSHDWGGALGWIFGHRYSHLIRRLVVVNCPHPKTLVRAVLRFEDFQTIRIPWVPLFQVPWVPEFFLTTALGRKGLKLSFTLREGEKGTMNVALVDELVSRFQKPDDMRGPINYYREMVRAQLAPGKRARLEAVYRTPIAVPVTLVWGAKDGALSARVAMNSSKDAGCYVECRPLAGVGHFVSLEAAEKLALEIRRLLSA
ncbi:MAG: alpha/beta hydrolase [Deltaproteobacteria bacterium]|nr:alpha/beta hydrolase [Deltaproteobacteria bacterium]